MVQNIKRFIEKLFVVHREYTNETWLTQNEIDRIFQIARELQR